MRNFLKKLTYITYFRTRILLFLSVFGPATITAMADNDAAGVVTYSIAGSKLGYPILFVLLIITILLGITQEMGIRISLITRKGFGDLIRENYGIRVSMLIFGGLFLANLFTVVVDMTAVKTTSRMLNLPEIPTLMIIVIFAILFVVKGNYKLNQNVFLVSSLLYIAYLISAFRAKPDWNLAVSNLFFPHGVAFTPEYIKNYIIISMGVLGTTITPWGQFFISSFASDKNIDQEKIKYSQLETYFGAFLTDFFSFFMIVATAATLFINGITLTSGEQAAIAIRPFAGEFASTLFAIGILNAGFMGIVIISLSTAYAFSEFFGLTGSLDSSFKQGPVFYAIFLFQVIFAALVSLFPSVSLFKLAITSQTINAMLLPLLFYYLIKLSGRKDLLGKHINNRFQKYYAIVGMCVIVAASIFTVVAVILNLG